LLVDRFLRDAASRFGRAVKPLTGDALRACAAHEWKGNVRELKSAIEQALLLAAGPEITAADLLGRVEVPGAGAPPFATGDGATPRSFREAKDHMVEAFERQFIMDALRRHGGNITKAAEEAGMYRQNFQQKMRELGITSEDAGS
jgi:DNA-binding NtrC family response regulator